MTNIDMGDDPLGVGAEESEIRRVDGRSRAGRQTRQTARESTRSSLRAGEVVGRDGEVLSRKRTTRSSDPFDIPPGIIPKGWEYQWVTVTVVGNGDIVRHTNLEFYDNGWRPVPASRHDGMFMATGEKGAVTYGGQMLMERPATLCQEARDEDYAKAVQQIRDRDGALMGRKANAGAIPDLLRNPAYKGRRTQMTIDEASDIPLPKHELAEAGD